MSEQQAQTGPQVIMQKIFLKDASVEVPHAPQVFTKEWKPKMDVQINTAAEKVAEGTQQITLSVTVTAKLEEETAYLVEVHQAGIFVLKGFPTPKDEQAVMGAYCPNVLFPYVRETVSDMIQRAGFPQFLLQPVNFDALFQEFLKQQQKPADATAH